MFPSFRRPPGRAGLALHAFTRRHFAAWRRLPAAIEPRDFGWGAAVDLGTALAEAGRAVEADAVLAQGLEAFPGDVTLLVRYALAAHNSQRHAAAVARWQAALAVAPDLPLCHLCLAAALRETGDIAGAEARIAGPLRRAPADLGVVSEAARIAETAGRFGEALALWRRVNATRAPPVEALRGEAHALMVLGRFAEADAALAPALARHPDAHPLLAVEAMLAAAREDWPRALALWQDYRRRFPDDDTGWEHHGRAVQASLLDRHETAAGATAPLSAPLRVDKVEDDELRRRLLMFESIGDNCEFGSVQRRYGAEPLGLLRWNDVAFDNLLRALEGRFAGMGEAAHTELAVLTNGEFIVRDRRWDLWMHTFLFEGQTDRAALAARMCRRVIFLRDKLLADLAAAEKTFVFRSEGLDGDRLEALHRALRGFGPARLLGVQRAGAPTGFDGAPGTLVRVAGDRCVGFLGRLGVAADNFWDIAYDDWVSICRQVPWQAGGLD